MAAHKSYNNKESAKAEKTETTGIVVSSTLCSKKRNSLYFRKGIIGELVPKQILKEALRCHRRVDANSVVRPAKRNSELPCQVHHLASHRLNICMHQRRDTPGSSGWHVPCTCNTYRRSRVFLCAYVEIVYCALLVFLFFCSFLLVVTLVGISGPHPRDYRAFVR